MNGRDVHNTFAALGARLVVFARTTITAQPSKGALDDPAAGQGLKSNLIERALNERLLAQLAQGQALTPQETLEIAALRLPPPSTPARAVPASAWAAGLQARLFQRVAAQAKPSACPSF